jgi:hypothetical protein
MKPINTLFAAFSFAAILSPAGFVQAADAPASASVPNAPAVVAAAEAAAATTPTPTAALNADTFDEGSLKALSPGDVRTLMRIINLPPEKLDSLRQSIDALAKMTPEEKQALRKKLETLRNAPPPPNVRHRGENPLVRYWNTLPPEKRKEETAKFQKMTREERRVYVSEVLKKLPPPPPREGSRNPPPRRGKVRSPQEPVPPSENR